MLSCSLLGITVDLQDIQADGPLFDMYPSLDVVFTE